MKIKPHEKISLWLRFKAWFSHKLRQWAESHKVEVIVEMIDGPHKGEFRTFHSSLFPGDIFYRWYNPKAKFAMYEMITWAEAKHCGWSSSRSL